MSSMIDNGDINGDIKETINFDDLKTQDQKSSEDILRDFEINSQSAKQQAGVNPPRIQVKPVMTARQVIEASQQHADDIRAAATEATYNPEANGQVISKRNVAIINWEKLTIDDVYNMDIPIEAKQFGADDPLKVELIDNTYQARWVYKSPRNLGSRLRMGFTYVTKEDLAANLNVDVQPDAQGHYCIDDVVLMRIPKINYFAALRWAHERAVNTLKSVQASKTGAQVASQFMQKQSAGFGDAVEQGKIGFYNPNITV